MLTGQNSHISADLATLRGQAGAKIAAAIETASAKTGVDFSYLLQQAQVESSFQADAKAKTSSATGLYQFIESTWLHMVRKYGDQYGLSHLASQISDSGHVANQKVRADILDLRNDARICSLMAGELAAENQTYLNRCVGGDIGSTELYMAHFMGPSGASKFLNALRSNPTASAADSFPQAAAANKNVFYSKTGQEKSLAEVYGFFDSKFKIDSDSVEAVSPSSLPDHITPSQEPLFEHVFQENNNKWVRVKSSHSTPLSSSWTPTDNLGGIAGLSPLFISPVDLLDLLKTDHTWSDRYNS